MDRRWMRDLMLLAAMLLLLRPRSDGAAVVVLRDGEEIGRYSLQEDCRLVIGEEDYNILVIQEGAAAVVEANCGDHTCVRTGEVRRAGEQIICLPHHLMVKVVGGETPDFDAVTQ